MTMNEDVVEQVVLRLFHEAAAAWPGLALPIEAFREHVAGLLARQADPAAYVATLHGVDLYLACACKERIPGAVEALKARYEADMDAALRSRKVLPAQREDLRQMLWEKLLVGYAGSPPKIGDYAGRGALGGWLRIATIRAALNFLEQTRDDQRTANETLDEDRHPIAPDAELGFLKAHYKKEVHQGLKDALAELDIDERNALRLHVLDGLSIDRIAAVYGVHRATAARWVARGRRALAERLRTLLQQRLRIDDAEVESILALVRSQLEASLSSVFRQPKA